MFETDDVGGILCNSFFECECSQSIVGESVRPAQFLGCKIGKVKCLKQMTWVESCVIASLSVSVHRALWESPCDQHSVSAAKSGK